jgi:hypothetical protein
VPDLVFGDFTLLFDVEATHEEVPLALIAGRSGDANFGGRWGWHTLDTCDSYHVFTYLLHLDIGDVRRYITVVVQRSLNLIQQLRSTCPDSDAA